MKLLLAFFGVVFASAEQWNHKQLDTRGEYHLYWEIQEDIIVFQVEVATKGWVGFGISPNGGMAGSDVIIAWISGGRTTFHDRYAKGKYMPVIDERQDWELLWSEENETHTIIRFQREINTCDKEQDLEITRSTTRLIYAFHREDPQSPHSVTYHGPVNRGTKSVNLFGRTEEYRHLGDPGDLFTWEIRSANAKIPQDVDTAYLCTFTKRPPLDRLNHVIKVEPVIQPGNERFVHHMILSECIDVDETKMDPLLGDFHQCYTETQAPKFIYCFNVLTAWAVGGEAMHLPENVGIPFGRPNSVYYSLEVHYDNPGYVKGIIDNSGFKLTYTPKLRKFNSGILVAGNLWNACMFVPPRQEGFVVSGHSHPTCLGQGIPKTGIKVHSVLPHTHLAGKKIRVRHFRNGKELPPVITDDHYDFNYQNFVRLPNEVEILPSDHLVVECTYDTSKRDDTTFGGLSTRQEMCLAMIAYYPEMAISMSVSCPARMNLVKHLGVTEMTEDGRFLVSPFTGDNVSFVDFVNSYPWDSNSVNAVQKEMMYSAHINMCSGKGSGYKLVFALSTYPKVAEVYTPPDDCPTGAKKKDEFYQTHKEESIAHKLRKF